jgi:tetratricopeptide (TPR) repeat protein
MKSGRENMPFVKKNDSQGSQPPTDARKIFIGREGELLFFVQNILKPEEPTHNIISIWGQGGVGKSTLLERIIAETHAPEFKDYCLTAMVDEHQATPANIMEKFVERLHLAGEFEKALGYYKERLRKLQTKLEAIQNVFLPKAPDFAGAAFEGIPIVGPILREGVKATTGHLLGEYHSNQVRKEAERFENPIDELTSAFVADLSHLADAKVTVSSNWVKRERRIILFFDTFEQLATETVPWLLDHFLEAEISSNVVLVVAGRDPLEHSTPNDPKRWLPYHDSGTIYSISLNSFTKDETHAYLTKRGITDPSRIDTIWQLSRGLPLYLGLLTSNPQGEVDPTKDVVDNFLRWIPEHEQIKRRISLDAALFTRPFNQDDLEAFAYLPENERRAHYRWLIRQPFVRNSAQDGRHLYHELAQELFSRHLNQLTPREYRATRRALANHYQRLLTEIHMEEGMEVYHSVQWLELVQALIFQLFLLPDEASHIRAIEQILNACEHAGAEQTREIVRILRELSRDQTINQANISSRQIAGWLQQYIEADLKSQAFLLTIGYQEVASSYLQTFLTMANHLLQVVSHESKFSSELLARMHCKRGIAYRNLKVHEQALEDFDFAIKLDSKYVRAYTQRGIVYRNLREYQQALVDLNRAIELDPRYAWAYAQRGHTYRLCKEYYQAIEDFDRALELDPKYARAYIQRGSAYRELRKYEQAIEDFDYALSLDPLLPWAYAGRGETYRLRNEIEQAIEDFDYALELDPKYSWAYIQRGIAYRGLQWYQRAIEDFDHALELDSKLAVAYASRGETHRLRDENEQAIKDFDSALELDSKFFWAYAHRGFTCRTLKRYEEAIRDYNLALELNSKYGWAYLGRGLTYLFVNDIELANADFIRCWELDSTNINSGWMAEWSRICQKRCDSSTAERLETIALQNPQHYIAYVCYGVALYVRGCFEEALFKLEQAIQQNIKAWDAYFWKGKVCAFLRRDEEAIATIEKSLELNMPPVLLTPLHWLEQDRPQFYEKYATQLLAQYEL